jgi:hypothetical protein
LLHFEARHVEGHYNLVEWLVADARGVSHFLLEQSADGLHFEPIGRLAALNVPEQRSYRLQDAEWASVSYYRLSIHDFDGSVAKSPVVAVHAPVPLALLSNPVGEQLAIESPDAGAWQVHDSQGRLVAQGELPPSELLRVPATAWSSGLYVLTFTSRRGRTSRHFIKK